MNGEGGPTAAQPSRMWGGSSADPLLALISSLAGLPILGMIGVSTPRALDGLGWPAPEGFGAKLWTVVAALCAWLAFPALIKVWKLSRKTWARSVALRDLPGPDYGLLGILPIIRRRRDIHRLATEWAEKYGPIVRVRFLLFHVSPGCRSWLRIVGQGWQQAAVHRENLRLAPCCFAFCSSSSRTHHARSCTGFSRMTAPRHELQPSVHVHRHALHMLCISMHVAQWQRPQGSLEITSTSCLLCCC